MEHCKSAMQLMCCTATQGGAARGSCRLLFGVLLLLFTDVGLLDHLV
jgi:hypothetical protein